MIRPFANSLIQQALLQHHFPLHRLQLMVAIPNFLFKLVVETRFQNLLHAIFDICQLWCIILSGISMSLNSIWRSSPLWLPLLWTGKTGLYLWFQDRKSVV